MKEFFKNLEKNCISGALVLLPLIVFFVVLEKVWSFFQKYGEKVSKLFHLDEIFGLAVRDVLGGVILILVFYCSGYLMRLAYLRKFTDWIDEKLMIFLPGYEKNKKLAEEKLKAKVKKTITDVPVLFKNGDCWQPGHLIEEAPDGTIVVFVPTAPFKDQGQIFIADSTMIKRLPETSLAVLDTSVKSYGKGILQLK